MFTPKTEVPIPSGNLAIALLSAVMLPSNNWRDNPASPECYFKLVGRCTVPDPETGAPTVVQVKFTDAIEFDEDGKPLSLGFEVAPPTPTDDEYSAVIETVVMPDPNKPGSNMTVVKLDEHGMPVFAKTEAENTSPFCAAWLLKHSRFKGKAETVVTVYGDQLTLTPSMIRQGENEGEIAVAGDDVTLCFSVNNVEEWEWKRLRARCRNNDAEGSERTTMAVGAGEHARAARVPQYRVEARAASTDRHA